MIIKKIMTILRDTLITDQVKISSLKEILATSEQALVFTKSNLNDEELKVLSKALHNNTNIVHLDLSYNDISYQGAQSLALLVKHTSIMNLNLDYNNIGAEGARGLAEGLNENRSLTHLSLVENQIGCAGATSLARVLEYNNSLLSVNLTCNKIHFQGAKSLATALKSNNTLQILDVAYNKLDSASAQKFAEILKTNTTLMTLNLTETHIGRAGIENIAAIVAAIEHKALKINIIHNENENAGLLMTAWNAHTQKIQTRTQACHVALSPYLPPEVSNIMVDYLDLRLPEKREPNS